MRSLLHIGLALVSLLVVAALVKSLAPTPLGDPRRGTDRLFADKLVYFDEHRDSFDVLFFGSSRVWAGVIPELFDAGTTALDRPARSFNFAVPAAHGHETDSLIRRVQGMKPARWRWAVIELDFWKGVVPPSMEFQPRTILWHDLPSTISGMRSIHLYSGQPREEKWEHMVTVLLHFGAHVTAFGRGPVAARHLLKPTGGRRHPAWLTQDRGYQEPAWGRDSLLKNLDRYQREVETLKTRNKPSGNLNNYNVQAVKSQAQRLRRAGVTPVYLVTPDLGLKPHYLVLKQQRVLEYQLSFNDPGAYPELYLVEHRWDRQHLNRAGAELFSAVLAESFVALFNPES